MSENLLNTAILAIAFLIVFGAGEMILKFFKVKAEVTRKTVHMSSGLLTMLFPVMLNNQWLVMLLCGSFFLILIISKMMGYLNAIHGVERVTYGSMLFPVAVYICYLVADKMHNWLYFFAPIQIMAISDMLAAIVGQKYKYKPYKIFKYTKTISGSLAFFISAFLIIVLFMLLLTSGTPLIIICTGLIVSFLVTIIEAISHKGIDNFTIPMGTLILLYAANIIFQ